MKTLGQRIKAARIAKGLTQFELAEYAHTTQHVISEYESGKYGELRPNLDRMRKIAVALEVDISWLLFGLG